MLNSTPCLAAPASETLSRKGRTESVRNEDLRVGDVVAEWYGTWPIVAIEPYAGPLTDIVFAVMQTANGAKCSLERGGYTDRVCVQAVAS